MVNVNWLGSFRHAQLHTHATFVPKEVQHIRDIYGKFAWKVERDFSKMSWLRNSHASGLARIALSTDFGALCSIGDHNRPKRR